MACSGNKVVPQGVFEKLSWTDVLIELLREFHLLIKKNIFYTSSLVKLVLAASQQNIYFYERYFHIYSQVIIEI